MFVAIVNAKPCVSILFRTSCLKPAVAMRMLFTGLRLVETCKELSMILHKATVAYYAHVFGHATVFLAYIVCDAGAHKD